MFDEVVAIGRRHLAYLNVQKCRQHPQSDGRGSYFTVHMKRYGLEDAVVHFGGVATESTCATLCAAGRCVTYKCIFIPSITIIMCLSMKVNGWAFARQTGFASAGLSDGAGFCAARDIFREFYAARSFLDDEVSIKNDRMQVGVPVFVGAIEMQILCKKRVYAWKSY